MDRPPRNYTEADFGVESIQMVSEDNRAQEHPQTVDVAPHAGSEARERDYGEMAERGVKLADVSLDSDWPLLTALSPSTSRVTRRGQ